MSINSIGTTTVAVPTAADYMKQTTGLNKDDFMKLFVTQMQHQDPLNPQDSSAMVAQLAQITQVEQTYNTNTNLKNLLSAANNAAGMSAVSFIGKTVSAYSQEVSLTNGGQAQLKFTLPFAVKQLSVNIYDASGKAVRTISSGSASTGNNQIVWDGKDNSGKALSTGLYSYQVNGLASDGSVVSGVPYIKAQVDGLKIANNETILTVGGVDVALANVTAINGQ